MYFVPEGQHDRSQALRASGVWTFRVDLAGVAAVSQASRFTLFSLGQTEKVCILRTPRRWERDDLSGQRDSSLAPLSLRRIGLFQFNSESNVKRGNRD